ncbi:MAG: glycosyltransferase [Streptomycetaceae bacterium]|nr:MAG: glycosyltransferase [Streptomycetaceae bacterium]
MLDDGHSRSPSLITVIVPVFNEAEVIPLFFSRIQPVLAKIKENYKVNLLFLNNASTDKSFEVISEIRGDFNFVHLITMSSNVGYQKSIECGLRNAKGDIFVVIDVDCEDPPEMILQFIDHYEKGFDLVYGLRADRSENKIMKLCRKFFYHIVRKVSDDEILLYMAEFALLTSEVRDATIASLDSFPFLRSSMARVGFKRIGISYKRQPRIAGETHYNLYGMTVFAIASILSSTTLPLRFPLYFMPWWTIGSVASIWGYFISGTYTYLLLFTTISCIYIGGALSAIALYLARTYKNGLQRPNYFIHNRYSFLQESLAEGD